MAEVISICLNDEESKMRCDVSAKYDCSVPSPIKRLARDILDEENELREVIDEYKAEKANGTLKTYAYEEIRETYGLD